MSRTTAPRSRGLGGRVRMVDVKSWKTRDTWERPADKKWDKFRIFQKMLVTPDGKSAVSASAFDGTISFWSFGQAEAVDLVQVVQGDAAHGGAADGYRLQSRDRREFSRPTDLHQNLFNLGDS